MYGKDVYIVCISCDLEIGKNGILTAFGAGKSPRRCECMFNLLLKRSFDFIELKRIIFINQYFEQELARHDLFVRKDVIYNTKKMGNGIYFGFLKKT